MTKEHLALAVLILAGVIVIGMIIYSIVIERQYKKITSEVTPVKKLNEVKELLNWIDDADDFDALWCYLYSRKITTLVMLLVYVVLLKDKDVN